MVENSRNGQVGRVAIVAATLVVLGAGPAAAFLETGTLLTNAASATYLGGNQGTSVTYSATAKILVANPAVNVWKEDSPTYVQTTGGLVTFQICFSNGGANTAFNLHVFDRLPNNAFWLPATYSGWYGNLSGQPTALDFYYCAGPACTMTSGGWTQDLDGPDEWTWDDGTSPVYLRWMTGSDQGLGVGASGCIAFTLSIG